MWSRAFKHYWAGPITGHLSLRHLETTCCPRAPSYEGLVSNLVMVLEWTGLVGGFKAGTGAEQGHGRVLLSANFGDCNLSSSYPTQKIVGGGDPSIRVLARRSYGVGWPARRTRGRLWLGTTRCGALESMGTPSNWCSGYCRCSRWAADVSTI